MGSLLLKMKRKLIMLGQAAAVTIPKKWLDKLGLKKGQDIDVSTSGNKLVITAESEGQVKKTKIHITGKVDTTAWWSLINLYQLGYDEIEVTYDDPKAIRLIESVVKEMLTGFAVVDQYGKTCILKSISKEIDFDTVLKRAFLVTLSYVDRTLELMKQGKIEETEDLKGMEDTINVLLTFCMRILNKYGYKDPSKANLMYTFVWHLEVVGDLFEDVSEIAREHPNVKVDDEFIEIYGKVNKLLKEAYNYYYKFEEDKLEELAVARKRLLVDIKKCKNPATSLIMMGLRGGVTDFFPLIFALHK